MLHLLRVFLVVLVTLLANCEATGTATKSQLTIATTNAGATAKAIQKFFVDDAKQNKSNGYLKMMNVSSADGEERGAGALASGQGPRVGAGTTVVSDGTGSSQTVTVTIYNNNGLWQRFQRWWNRLFHRSSSSARRLR
ncbi:putative RxLR effector [Phytophthora cinnamomi]|uniref:putative RxLR effector n=1 Tax=Phytophthora cinnamomi TaxID=4785 RepID=UPI002A271315|nr:putative RxLR effector [Phytophthora cinnamomi]KAJ8571470.1 hypothetical protein ON010_g5365 [Phytophthora cinnamomi]